MSIINNGLLLASEAAAAGGYTVSRSLRFNSSDSAYLSRTPSSAGNRKTWTFSCWVKRAGLGTNQLIFGSSTNWFELYFHTSDQLRVYWETTGTGTNLLTSNAVFRDASAWMHIVWSVDTTQATASNRIRVYVNGTEITWASASYPSQNYDTGVNLTNAHGIGSRVAESNLFLNAYLANVEFVDGSALTPSSFAETNATTGQWVPKAFSGGSYGTNGFRLTFSDNSGTTSSTLGKDTSGNNNDWTPTNFSVAAGAGNDSLVDTPSSYGTDTGAGGEVRGNYCTLNPLAGKLTVTLSDGNLTRSGTVANNRMGTIGMSSGKWYWEVLIQNVTAMNFIGVTTYENEPDGYAENYVYSSDGGKYIGTTPSSYGASYGVNDIIGVAYDADTGTLTCYKNGVSQGQLVTGISKRAFPLSRTDGTGQHTFNFGQRQWAYAAPAGFKALCDTNLPTPVVAKPSEVMDVKLYTGTGGSQSITGIGFNPDLVWIKARSSAYKNELYDAVRGAQKSLNSDATTAEETHTNSLSSFDSAGFSFSGGRQEVNAGSTTYAAWCWDAGSSTVSNTQGSITSTVRANASAGFSIVTYTGTGSAATVGHGLGVAPSMIIVKSRNTAGTNWGVYHSGVSSTPQNSALNLDNTAALDTQSVYWNNTAPTSTVFSVGTWGGSNGSTRTYVAYCFAPVAGYSSFGTWTGNGSADGPFIWTGFRPRFIIMKDINSTNNWQMLDTARDTYNVASTRLFPNQSVAETSATTCFDFLSNGFKARNQFTTSESNITYIYGAWAENPFQYARAR